MSTKTVDIAEAQASLPALVSLVNSGVEVVLTKDSTPVACLVPMGSPPIGHVPALHPGAVRTSDDSDEPLPNESCPGGKKAGKLADWLGCLEHLHVSVVEDDIAVARREMWADFPRDLPL